MADSEWISMGAFIEATLASLFLGDDRAFTPIFFATRIAFFLVGCSTQRRDNVVGNHPIAQNDSRSYVLNMTAKTHGETEWLSPSTCQSTYEIEPSHATVGEAITDLYQAHLTIKRRSIVEQDCHNEQELLNGFPIQQSASVFSKKNSVNRNQ